jgi:negative modulator of initiation of replication
MKSIEIDEALYQHIASNTQYIGESASSILRRLLSLPHDISVKENSQKHEAVLSIENPVIVEADIETVDYVPVNLTENTDRNISVFNYINKEELATQRGAVGRFLLILAALYRVYPTKFEKVSNIRGRDRLYFAESEEALAQSGSSTKPRQIPDSPYWVITNSNTTRKKMMLTEVSSILGYSVEETEKIRDLL